MLEILLRDENMEGYFKWLNLVFCGQLSPSIGISRP